jgi:hypothetical protein
VLLRESHRDGTVLNRYKVDKHADLVIGDAFVEYAINDARVAQEDALDGIYVIRTAVPPARINTTVPTWAMSVVAPGHSRTNAPSLTACSPCETTHALELLKTLNV